MTVFVSWSGQRSRVLAQAVCSLLKSAIPNIDPWMSTDIRRGTPWASELFVRLDEANTCILCLTADSVGSPWPAFEVGTVTGASSGKATVLRLAFDVSEEAAGASYLRTHSFFTCDAASGVRLLEEVGRAENVTPIGDVQFARHWEEFRRRLGSIPPLVPRSFELVTYGPGGLVVTNIDLEQDHPWTSLLDAICETESLVLSRERWEELRYLDMSAECWLPVPLRLSDVKVARLAVLHPDVEIPGESPRVAAMMLRETLDERPAMAAAHATLRRDLKDLAAAQQHFLANGGHYASSLQELSFIAAPENELNMTVGANGWSAVATRKETRLRFGIRAGDGAGYFADREEGHVFIV